MPDYQRLEDPPRWCAQQPTCSACQVTLGFLADYSVWQCPSCGSMWDRKASDGDEGQLPFPAPTGPVIPNERASRARTLGESPTEADAKTVGGDLLGKRLNLYGLVHRLKVMPNENATGWIIFVNGAGANMPQAQAELVARLLLSGPDEGPDL